MSIYMAAAHKARRRADKSIRRFIIITALNTAVVLAVILPACPPDNPGALCRPAAAFACTDVLNAFLSVEKLNEKVKESLIKINDAFQHLDVALSQRDLPTSKTEMGKLIDSYFDFYLTYYQNPPAQFVDDPRWRDKLSDVNAKIKIILNLINQGRADDAHKQVESAYNSFSAIYIDRIPMQEQNVFDLIASRLDSIETELAAFNPLITDETALHANNLKSLADRLNSFNAPDAQYAENRNRLTAFITEKANKIIVNPPRDTASCELIKLEAAALKSSVEVFIEGRKKSLDKEWFK